MARRGQCGVTGLGKIRLSPYNLWCQVQAVAGLTFGVEGAHNAPNTFHSYMGSRTYKSEILTERILLLILLSKRSQRSWLHYFLYRFAFDPRTTFYRVL